MIKTTKTKVYDTETATLIKKMTYSYYGDPEGYEKIIYLSPEGYYFLYTNGGETSRYPEEKITTFTKKKALEWIQES